MPNFTTTAKKAKKAKKKFRTIKRTTFAPSSRPDPISLLTLEMAQKGDPPYISRLTPRARMIVDLYFKYRNKPAYLAQQIARNLQITLDKAIGLERRYLRIILNRIEEDKP